MSYTEETTAKNALLDAVQTELNKAQATIARLEAENERLKRCYESATGKKVCGEGSVIRVECKQMTELRAKNERLESELKDAKDAQDMAEIANGVSYNSYQLEQARVEELEAENAVLREVLELCLNDEQQIGLKFPENTYVRVLCEQHGYGAVMASVARLWAMKDPIGAFTCGPCRETVRQALASAPSDYVVVRREDLLILKFRIGKDAGLFSQEEYESYQRLKGASEKKDGG